MPMNFSYDVALSFAGEDRDFAEAVAAGFRDAVELKDVLYRRRTDCI